MNELIQVELAPDVVERLRSLAADHALSLSDVVRLYVASDGSIDDQILFLKSKSGVSIAEVIRESLLADRNQEIEPRNEEQIEAVRSAIKGSGLEWNDYFIDSILRALKNLQKGQVTT